MSVWADEVAAICGTVAKLAHVIHQYNSITKEVYITPTDLAPKYQRETARESKLRIREEECLIRRLPDVPGQLSVTLSLVNPVRASVSFC